MKSLKDCIESDIKHFPALIALGKQLCPGGYSEFASLLLSLHAKHIPAGNEIRSRKRMDSTAFSGWKMDKIFSSTQKAMVDVFDETGSISVVPDIRRMLLFLFHVEEYRVV